MGKWCLHASSFIFDRIIIKVDRHKSSDEFNFGTLVSMAHLYVFWNEIWPWHIGFRWAISALWATCFNQSNVHNRHDNGRSIKSYRILPIIEINWQWFFGLLIRYSLPDSFPKAYIYKFSQLFCQNLPKLNIFSQNENRLHNKMRLQFFYLALTDIRILTLTLKKKKKEICLCCHSVLTKIALSFCDLQVCIDFILLR